VHRIEERHEQYVGADRHALRLRQQIAQQRSRLQHLHRRGEIVVRDPEGRQSAVTGDAHLIGRLFEDRLDIRFGRVLRAEIKTDLHRLAAFKIAPTAVIKRAF
jgi:hypothetical protein